jgi:hypothetical protein
MRYLLTTLAVVPLAACTIATSDATADNPPSGAGSCNNESLAQFTGQPASQELGDRMLRASGARVLRWVPKGSAVTMDYREDRLTIALDGSNRVERANCG